MANTGSQPSFFLIYGWISGPSHGRRLSRLLQAAGFTLAGSPEAADIIITHSAGFYLIPEGASEKLIILVGPTLNKLTFGNWLQANLENARMFWRDGQVLRGFWLNFMHIVDIFLQAPHNARIVRSVRQSEAPRLEHNTVVLIANQDDPWPKKAYLDAFALQTPWAFISMRGAHENIWEQPEQYIEVIEAYAKRLLA